MITMVTEVSVSKHKQYHSGSDRCQQRMLIDCHGIDYQCQTHCFCHCGRAGRCGSLWKEFGNAKSPYTTLITHMENGRHFFDGLSTQHRQNINLQGSVERDYEKECPNQTERLTQGQEMHYGRRWGFLPILTLTFNLRLISTERFNATPW